MHRVPPCIECVLPPSRGLDHLFLALMLVLAVTLGVWADAWWGGFSGPLVGLAMLIVAALSLRPAWRLQGPWWIRQERGQWAWGRHDGPPRTGAVEVALDAFGWLLIRARRERSAVSDWLLLRPQALGAQGHALRATLYRP